MEQDYGGEGKLGTKKMQLRTQYTEKIKKKKQKNPQNWSFVKRDENGKNIAQCCDETGKKHKGSQKESIFLVKSKNKLKSIK